MQTLLVCCVFFFLILKSKQNGYPTTNHQGKNSQFLDTLSYFLILKTSPQCPAENQTNVSTAQPGRAIIQDGIFI